VFSVPSEVSGRTIIAPMSAVTPWTLITEPEALRQLADELNTEGLVAVDTESNSLHAFQEQVCLVQFTANGDDILVDPLAVPDISPLGPLFENPGIEKIFHAAEYDLMVLARDYDFRFANLFDTMVAARILGRDKVGLGNLLEAEFGVKLAKKHQRANWGRRPLTADMLDYARLDTHYLIELRTKLKQDLMERERWAIAEEDFRRLVDTVLEPPEFDASDVWRVKGASKLQPEVLAVLQKLVDYRGEQAKRADVPLFKILGDKTLVAIAEARPSNNEELGALEGMSEGQVRRHGRGLLAAVQAGRNAGPPQRPKRSPYDEEFVERVDALREWRKNAAKAMEVESDVVLPRDLMESIARHNPRNPRELEADLGVLPWRLEHYGDEILDVLRKAGQ